MGYESAVRAIVRENEELERRLGLAEALIYEDSPCIVVPLEELHPDRREEPK